MEIWENNCFLLSQELNTLKLNTFATHKYVCVEEKIFLNYKNVICIKKPVKII
jgi:hypothetical protein